MDRPSHRGSGSAHESARPVDVPYQPSIRKNDIFRQLIVDEIRQGRMTAGRRRQIIRYAREMRFSARETERLIIRCRDDLLRSNDPDERFNARTAVCADNEGVHPALKIANAVGIILVGYLLLLRWLI